MMILQYSFGQKSIKCLSNWHLALVKFDKFARKMGPDILLVFELFVPLTVLSQVVNPVQFFVDVQNLGSFFLFLSSLDDFKGNILQVDIDNLTTFLTSI